MMELDRTREIINQLSSKGKAPIGLKDSKTVMVILTGTSTAIDEWIKPLIRARGYGLRYELVLSKTANEMLDINKLTLKLQPRRVIVEGSTIEETHSIENIDAIITPLLSQNTAFKLLNGIQDQLIPRLLWQGLWIGKPIWLNLEGLRAYRGQEAANGAMRRLVEENIQRLISMGVKEINFEDYIQEITTTLACKEEVVAEVLQANGLHNVRSSNCHNTPLSISSGIDLNSSIGLAKGLSTRETSIENSIVQCDKKIIITEGDILSTPTEIKEIKVGSNSIITPLAYDTAKRRGIKIIKA